MTKSLRILEIIKIIKDLGRASPKEIQLRLSSRLSIDSKNVNFIRTTYRDLKELCDLGLIQGHEYLPDGTSIGEEADEITRNIRVEYSLNENSNQKAVRGWNLLASCGYTFITNEKNIQDWQVSEVSGPSTLKNFFSILFRQLNGKFLALQSPALNLPVSIIIGRPIEKPSPSSSLLPLLEPNFGRRVSYLFCPDPSISRFIPEKKKWGHCLIKVNADKNITTEDLGSSTGSELATITHESLDRLISNSAATHSKMQRQELKSTGTVASPFANETDKTLQAGDSLFYLATR